MRRCGRCAWLVPAALWVATGCAPSEWLTGGPVALVSSVRPKADPADGPPSSRAQELPVDQALHVCWEVAKEMEDKGNDDGAREQYEKILKLDPNSLKAARRLAVLYDRRGDFSRAEAQYARLARAFPKDADLFSDWGYSYYLRTGEENWQKAEEKLRFALSLNKNHARAHSNLGLVLGQLKRYPEALQEFRAAGVSEAEAHCNLAFVYWTQYKLEEARRECRTAQQLDPSCHQAKEMLAQLDVPPRQPSDSNRFGRGGDRAAARRDPRTPRAATVSPAQWAAERAMAEKLVAERYGPLPSASAQTAVGTLPTAGPTVSAVPAESQPVIYRSPNGTGWVPVKPLSPPPAPSTTGMGNPGTIMFD